VRDLVLHCGKPYGKPYEQKLTRDDRSAQRPAILRVHSPSGGFNVRGHEQQRKRRTLRGHARWLAAFVLLTMMRRSSLRPPSHWRAH